ncbi:MAG: HAD-IIB family hydrolase [Hespellia sp.]|nr:HAD-IIB family hydrolase [Hespellia sp.]
MKKLYLSDLDGTLFTTKKQLTDRSIQLLNECMDAGASFGVATARMPYGCDYRLEGLHLTAPSILTNGVFLYDFETETYLSIKTMKKSAVIQVFSIFEQFQTGVFLYTFAENKISIHYNQSMLTEQTQYYSDRALQKCSIVAYHENLSPLVGDDNTVYLACTGPKAELEPIHTVIQDIAGVSCAFYLNIYNGLYCIEIFSDQATKKNALLELKKRLNCEEVIVFGDNLNDLSMMEVADRSYAVENALDEVKRAATGVIAGCNEDGVARFMHDEIFQF